MPHAKVGPLRLASRLYASSLAWPASMHAAQADEPKETSSGEDSYSKIEAPVRDSIPDGGKPVSERNWGQNVLNAELKSKGWNRDTVSSGVLHPLLRLLPIGRATHLPHSLQDIFGTQVGFADAMR